MSDVAELLRLRDEVVGLKAEIAELQSRSAEQDGCRRLLEEAEESMRRLELELDALRASWTWKVGRGILFPVRSLRSIFRGFGSSKIGRLE